MSDSKSYSHYSKFLVFVFTICVLRENIEFTIILLSDTN